MYDENAVEQLHPSSHHPFLHPPPRQSEHLLNESVRRNCQDHSTDVLHTISLNLINHLMDFPPTPSSFTVPHSPSFTVLIIHHPSFTVLYSLSIPSDPVPRQRVWVMRSSPLPSRCCRPSFIIQEKNQNRDADPLRFWLRFCVMVLIRPSSEGLISLVIKPPAQISSSQASPGRH